MTSQIPKLLAIIIAISTIGLDKVYPTVRYKREVLRDLIKSVQVESHTHHQNLTIFPLISRSSRDRTRYLTLDEAIRRGDLRITELGDGIVNEVLVKNNSRHYVFIMAGEIITGSKQDRMVSYDCLLPPKSKKVRLSVYCVEQGRWTSVSKEFNSTGESAHIQMRKLAKAKKSQGSVWREVEEKGAKLKVAPSTTRAFTKVLEDRDVQKNMEPYYKKFTPIPNISPDINGVVVVEGDRIVVCDLFSSPELFRKLWPKLLRSYVLEVMNTPYHSRSLSRRDVKEFIRDALDAHIETEETDGVGRAVEISSNRIFGTALIHHENVVHFDLFPNRDILLNDSYMDNDPRRQRIIR
jgi:hypothetical protein